MRKVLAIVLVAIAIASFAVVKIGAVFPMTGNLAAVGEAAWKGLQLAYQLKPKVLGQKVQIVLVDNRSEKTEAANAVTRLITKEKVVAIIGAMSSSNTLA